ncbi:hypothetical protein Pst134EB_025216 [Puccinia striiformis f. sp. tritici]|nr:hypothetical protein Pst134EB_025216 [Puccinia striiformis f. sp. tritici]
MPSHLRNGRDISHEQRQQALEYQLSPAGAARLQQLGVKPAAAGRRITLLGPGRTATGSRDQPGVDQLKSDVSGSRINQREVVDAGVQQVHASTATNQKENFPPFHRPVPTSAPTGTAPAPTQPIPTPSTDREDSMDIILDHPGLNSLITVLNGQWEMFIKARESRDISMMRFSLNAAAGTQEMIQNRVGREEMIRLSLNWNAREELASMDEPYRPQNLIQNQNLPPAHHVAGSIPVLNNSNVGLPPPPPPPPPQPAPMVDQYMSHHQVSSRPQSRHDQYSAPMGYGYQHQPPYHHPAGYATNQFQPRPPGNWRGSGRNRRRPPSATVDIMRMGQFFVRAEAVMGRMRRIHQNRASQRPPQTRNPPPAPH